MIQKNMDIRGAIKKAGVRQWRVAEAYGLCEGNFSRLLRKELDKETKKHIYSIIQELQKSELGQAACVSA